MLVLRYVTHLLPCPVMCHGDVEKHSKSLWYSELLTTHARKTEPEINCSILHLFAYQPKDSSPSNFETKKVQNDEEYIFSYLLPQKAGSEEGRDSARHGSYHGGRKPDTVQLQADRRSEVVGHQRRACHGQKHGGTRNEPHA